MSPRRDGEHEQHIGRCWVSQRAASEAIDGTTKLVWTLVIGQRKQTCCDSLRLFLFIACCSRNRRPTHGCTETDEYVYDEYVVVLVLAKHLTRVTHPLNIYNTATQRQTTGSFVFPYAWRMRTREHGKAARPWGAPTRLRDFSDHTCNCNHNHDPLEPFTYLFLVLVRTNLTLLRPPVPLVVSTSSTAKQLAFATTSAVQTVLDDATLDEDHKLFSQSQTVCAVSFTSAPIIISPATALLEAWAPCAGFLAFIISPPRGHLYQRNMVTEEQPRLDKSDKQPILVFQFSPSSLPAGTSHIPRLRPSLPPAPRRPSPSLRVHAHVVHVPPPFATLDCHIPRNANNCHQRYPRYRLPR